MPQIKNRIQSKPSQWSINKRYRPGDTVKYKDYLWTNITGANSEPVNLSVDWFKGAFLGDISDSVPFGGFRRFKAPGNFDNSKWQSGDFGYGFTSDGRFLKPGIYLSGNPISSSSWSELGGDFIEIDLQIGGGSPDGEPTDGLNT